MEIERVINIGPKLGADLRKVGIDSLETLQQLGLAQAWSRLQSVAPERDCTHACLTLAGAMRGIRWHGLSVEEKRAIMEEVGGGSL